MTNIDERAEIEKPTQEAIDKDIQAEIKHKWALAVIEVLDMQAVVLKHQARASLNTAALAEKDAAFDKLRNLYASAMVQAVSQNDEIERLKRVADAANNAYSRMGAAGLGMTDEGVALVEALAAAQQERQMSELTASDFKACNFNVWVCDRSGHSYIIQSPKTMFSDKLTTYAEKEGKWALIINHGNPIFFDSKESAIVRANQHHAAPQPEQPCTPDTSAKVDVCQECKNDEVERHWHLASIMQIQKETLIEELPDILCANDGDYDRMASAAYDYIIEQARLSQSTPRSEAVELVRELRQALKRIDGYARHEDECEMVTCQDGGCDCLYTQAYADYEQAIIKSYQWLKKQGSR